MKEAIGNSFLTTIALVFSFLIMAMLVGSLSYSKTYKAKNKIVSIIEKYNDYTSATQADIDTDLKKLGYKINTTSRRCGEQEGMTLVHDTSEGSYDYCLYRVKTSRGYYFHAVTYLHFDIPMVGQYLTFQVRGDSRTIYNNLEG